MQTTLSCSVRRHGKQESRVWKHCFWEKKAFKNFLKKDFGGNKQWGGFIDPDSVAMVLQCNHRVKAEKGNDNCSDDIVPAKAMKLLAEELKAYDEFVPGDPDKRTILTSWSSTTGAFFLERTKYNELPRANRVQRHHERKNASIQETVDVVSSNLGNSASLQQPLLYTNAPNETLQQRWALVSDTQCPRELHLTISTNKRKIMGPYFQALRNKLGNSKKTILLYEDDNFVSYERGQRRCANEEYEKSC